MQRYVFCGVLALALALVSCSDGSGPVDAGIEAIVPDLPAADVPEAEVPVVDVPAAENPGDAAIDAPDASGAHAVIVPPSIAFGQVTFGCFSKSNQVCLVNTGIAPLDWTGLSQEACSTSEFLVKGDLPVRILPGEKACLAIAFGPQEAGEKTCDLVVQIGQPPEAIGTVHLSAEARPGKEITDTFTQVSGQEVDILFVLDDGPSMCEHLPALHAAIQDYVDSATLARVDFHVGVVSADTAPARQGLLNRGNRFVTPRWVSRDRDDLALLPTLADLGCDGGASATQSGLAAALAAVSAPLTTDTGIACSTDDACRADVRVCTDPAACPFLCQGAQSTCSGWNTGFLRDTAQLEFYLVSDRPDHDPRTVPFFVDAFKNIKGFYNVDLMHVNAVLEPPGGCTAGADTPIPEDDRYRQVVTETHGLLGSLCDEYWGSILQSLPTGDSFGKQQFFLSRLAEPSSIQVIVNGQDCTDHWRYDFPSNSVIPESMTMACFPEPGQQVSITYNELCLTS
jgi:hypothetical protein